MYMKDKFQKVCHVLMLLLDSGNLFPSEHLAKGNLIVPLVLLTSMNEYPFYNEAMN